MNIIKEILLAFVQAKIEKEHRKEKRAKEQQQEIEELKETVDSMEHRARFGKWGSSYGDVG